MTESSVSVTIDKLLVLEMNSTACHVWLFRGSAGKKKEICKHGLAFAA